MEHPQIVVAQILVRLKGLRHEQRLERYLLHQLNIPRWQADLLIDYIIFTSEISLRVNQFLLNPLNVNCEGIHLK